MVKKCATRGNAYICKAKLTLKVTSASSHTRSHAPENFGLNQVFWRSLTWQMGGANGRCVTRRIISHETLGGFAENAYLCTVEFKQ